MSIKIQSVLQPGNILLLFIALFSFPVVAGQGYVATLVKNTGAAQVEVGVLTVDSRGNKRLVIDQPGLKTIYIVNRQQHRRWVLDPENKVYIERPDESSPIGLPDLISADDPCEGLAEVSCTRMGDEPVNGRIATRWKIQANIGGQHATGTQWIDNSIGQVIKQTSAGGYSTELKNLKVVDPSMDLFEIPAGYKTIQ